MNLLVEPITRVMAKRNRESFQKTSVSETVQEIQRLIPTLDPRDLQQHYANLRMTCLKGATADDSSVILIAIALAARQIMEVLKLEPYSVQHHAAVVMAQGDVAEMATGEGKTLAIGMAAIAVVAGGQGVHIATANDYLSERDHQTLWPVFKSLGLSSCFIGPQVLEDQRRRAYTADIVYCTADTLAFDFLRDTVRRRQRISSRLGSETFLENPQHLPLCRRRNAVLIDEIDHILIDEADTPLILSVPDADAPPIAISVYQAASEFAHRLEEGLDWKILSEGQRVRLTDRGRAAVACQQPNTSLARPWPEYVERAIEAETVFHRDVDYVVRNDKVEIVDPATGRVSEGRQWQDGLHQAVEYSQQLTPTPECAATAQITRWRFFDTYRQVSGCSGTAWDCRDELKKVYQLNTFQIPLRCDSARKILSPRFFPNSDAKWDAVVDEIFQVHAQGRPILVGTRTIQDSQQLADRLESHHLPFQLLNGNQEAQEANIVAAAGRQGAITIATDLAGRGTDIQLSGQTIASGGLHVIVVEPRNSVRLDRQLVGRAARQGQPGSARTFIAANDALIVEHAPALARLLAGKPIRPGSERSLERSVRSAAHRSEAKKAAVRFVLAQRDRQRDAFFHHTKITLP